MTRRKLQTYECRLRKSRVLRLSDVGGLDSIPGYEAAARAGHALCKGLPHEQVWAILLNGRNELTGAIRLGEGGAHGCGLRPADVLRPVLLSGCSGFVLVHNHPSGDPTPSRDDVELTRAIWEAGKLVGVHLLDHVIVTQRPGNEFSMAPLLGLSD